MNTHADAESKPDSTIEVDDISELDYVRRLVREPPPLTEVAAHLVWVRLMAQVLANLEQWAPHFTTALVSTYRSLERFRPYCESGAFERAYVDRVPHALSFLRYFLSAGEEPWLRDIARCEIWAACLRGTVPKEHHAALRTTLGIDTKLDKEYVIVSHDVLETLQHLVGYADTTMSRTGRLLWYLGVPPIFPVQRAAPRPGIVVFMTEPGGERSDVAMAYVPAEGA